MLNFIGTCVSADIAKIAEKHGRPSSYKNACRQIKRDYPKLYEELALNLYNPWENETNIKKIEFFSVTKKGRMICTSFIITIK